MATKELILHAVQEEIIDHPRNNMSIFIMYGPDRNTSDFYRIQLSLLNPRLGFWINNSLTRGGFRLSFEELLNFLDTINYDSIYKIVSYSNRMNNEYNIYWLTNSVNPPLRQVLDINIPSDDCSICLEPLVDSKVCGNVNCAHLYHCKCIDEWIKTPDVFGDRESKKCPICRANLIVFEADDNRRIGQLFDFGKSIKFKLKDINRDINYLIFFK